MSLFSRQMLDEAKLLGLENARIEQQSKHALLIAQHPRTGKQVKVSISRGRGAERNPRGLAYLTTQLRRQVRVLEMAEETLKHGITQRQEGPGLSGMTEINPMSAARRDYVPVERPCMTCRKPFPSRHKGERICVRCKSSDAYRETSLGDGEYTRHR